MGVSNQGDPVGLGIETELSQKRREHVLPDWIARTRVIEADQALERLRLKLGEIGEVLREHHLSCPLGREACTAGEFIEREFADYCEVVIARKTDGDVLAGEIYTCVWLRAVTDEIAQTPELRCLGGRDSVQYRFESVPV